MVFFWENAAIAETFNTFALFSRETRAAGTNRLETGILFLSRPVTKEPGTVTTLLVVPTFYIVQIVQIIPFVHIIRCLQIERIAVYLAFLFMAY
jgi:hypothetical protein